MRETLFIRDCNIVRQSGGKEENLTISRVLAEHGTRAMLALDRGEKVFIITETEKDSLADRVGS